MTLETFIKLQNRINAEQVKINTKNTQEIEILKKSVTSKPQASELPVVHVIEGADSYWLVDVPNASLIEVYSFINRTKAQITITNNNGAKMNKEFLQGEPVAITLPIGHWKVESSSDGINYTKIVVLDSVDNPPYGPSQRVNVILNGQIFAPFWARYTKI